MLSPALTPCSNDSRGATPPTTAAASTTEATIRPGLVRHAVSRACPASSASGRSMLTMIQGGWYWVRA